MDKQEFVDEIKKERLRDPEPSLLQIIRRVQDNTVPEDERKVYTTKAQALWIIAEWNKEPKEKVTELQRELVSLKEEFKDLKEYVNLLSLDLDQRSKEKPKETVNREIVNREIVNREIVNREIVNKEIINKEIINKCTKKLKLAFIGYNAAQEREIRESFNGEVDYKFFCQEKSIPDIGNIDYVIYSKFVKHRLQFQLLGQIPKEKIIRVPGGMTSLKEKINSIITSKK